MKLFAKANQSWTTLSGRRRLTADITAPIRGVPWPRINRTKTGPRCKGSNSTTIKFMLGRRTFSTLVIFARLSSAPRTCSTTTEKSNTVYLRQVRCQRNRNPKCDKFKDLSTLYQRLSYASCLFCQNEPVMATKLFARTCRIALHLHFF